MNAFGTLYEEGGSSLGFELIELYLGYIVPPHPFCSSVYITLYDSSGKLA